MKFGNEYCDVCNKAMHLCECSMSVVDAQADYDKAIQEEKRAEHALAVQRGFVQGSRERLERVKCLDAATIPVDRSARQLTDGSPVSDDHREINPDAGMQKGYVVLSSAERAKGFVRPFRDAYRHVKCGAITIMSRPLAETYARDPEFYSGTFCSTCRAHFPVGEDGEFTWHEMNGSEGPKVGI